MCSMHQPAQATDAIDAEARRILPLLHELQDSNREFVRDVRTGASDEDLACDHTRGNLLRGRERFENVFFKSSLKIARSWSREQLVAILVRARALGADI